MRTLGLTLALTLIAIPAARAGDPEAEKLYAEARAAWKGNKEPGEVVGLLDKALAAEPKTRELLYQILLTKGKYLQGIVSDLPAAEAVYTRIIKELAAPKETETVLREIKSEAMAAKAVVVYSDRKDVEAAFGLFKGAVLNWAKSSICDNGSQFLYRLGRDAERPEAKRKELLEFSLKCSQDALNFVEKEVPQAEQRAPILAKYQLQLAIVQHATGKADDAAKTFAAIDKAQLEKNPMTLYQHALWHNLNGDVDATTKALEEFMKKTRAEGPAGLKARNQLRKYIRNEPDFKPHLGREDWKGLVTDEAAQ